MVKRGGEKPRKPKGKKIRRARQSRQAGRGETAPGQPASGGRCGAGAGWGAVTLSATFAGDFGASGKSSEAGTCQAVSSRRLAGVT